MVFTQLNGFTIRQPWEQSKDPEQSPMTDELSSLFKDDSNEQYGRRDNVSILGVKEEANKNVYQKVDVAMKKL